MHQVSAQQLEMLTPQPRCAYIRQEISAVFSVQGINRILFDSQENEKFAIRLQTELYKRGFTDSIEILPLTSGGNYNGAIILGVCSSIGNSIINQMEMEQSIVVDKEYPGKEGYALDITPGRCVINGSDESGLFYGIQTFLQMLDNASFGSLRACRIVDAPQYPIRWFYYPTNFLVGANVDKAKAIWDTASSNKLNGAYVNDYKFEFISQMPQRYIDSLQSLRKYSEEQYISFIAGCMPFGYSNSIMFSNPNLAAGLPVQGQKFIIEADTARLVPSFDVSLSNPGFEVNNGDNFPGYTYIDRPGVVSFVDKQISKSGNTSIRFSNFEQASKPLNARVTKRVQVKPFTEFHASAWVKSENLKMSYRFQIIAIGNTGRTLCFQSLNLPTTSNWTKYDVSFNSLDNDTITVYWGVWGPEAGTFWMDDLLLEETAFMNLIRRPGTPLNVSHQFLDIAYEEGVDYDSLVDLKMGRLHGYGGDYDFWHQPPVFKIKEGSNIRNGDTLIMSYYHTTVIYDSQVMASTTEPEVYEILERELTLLDSVANPEHYFMNHDEIRVMNWDAGDRQKKKTPKELLSDNVTKSYDIIRGIRADASIWDWSDMFDEYHNAKSTKSNYYLVNGSFGGVANDIPNDIGIVNWNHSSDESLDYFSKLGFKQITAPFYDKDANHIRLSKEKAKNVEGFMGMLYTTWRKNYDYLQHHGWYLWNHPPFIYHQPPHNFKRESFNLYLTVSGDKWDSGWELNDVKIFYRFSADDDFVSDDINGSAGNYSYVLDIPSEAALLQYYITASDNRGWVTKVPYGDDLYYEYLWTDIETQDSDDFPDLSYNSTSQTLKISNKISALSNIKVYNLIGGIVYNGNFSSEFELNLNDYDTGVYIVYITNNVNSMIRKIIKY